MTEDVACIEMPNSFTPNNDGTNDMWNLDFQVTRMVPSKYIQNGEIWFGNRLEPCYRGMEPHNGQVLPAGTYYYILDIDNGTLTQNGPVTIVK